MVSASSLLLPTRKRTLPSSFFATRLLVMGVFFILTFYGTCFGIGCYKNHDIDDSGPVVVTKTGIVVGKYTKVFDKEIATFLGIPFAKPPLGEKRFLNPEPVDPSNKTYLAKEKSPACMQYSTRKFDWIPLEIEVSEDCLYLNIWLPPNCCCNRLNKVPVMVWIHGGGYSAGSASMDLYDGSILATYGDVIVVTVNYRLGVFGFLNLGTKEASGNMGLHDNILALKWVRKNIQQFGGNPDSITLFGESTGSESVNLLMVSPLSRNLFHKAILQSGTAYQPILVDNITMSLGKASILAEMVGCSTPVLNSNSILDCLKKKTALQLSQAENTFTSNAPAFFLPSYGDECEECVKFLLEHPIKTIQFEKFLQIPTLIGSTENEGTIFLAHRKPDIFRFDQKTSLTVAEAKQILQLLFQGIQIPYDELFDYYIKNGKETKRQDYVQVIADIFGDYLLKCPSMYFADKMKEVYFYWFTHRSLKDITHQWLGVTHFSEVPYVFGKPINDTQKYTLEDQQFSEDLIRKFSSFARHGYPFQVSVQLWSKYSSPNRMAYDLNYKSKGNIQLPGQEECEFLRPYFKL